MFLKSWNYCWLRYYDIATYAEGSSPNLADQCNSGCAVTASIHESLGPCVNDQCVSSIKYTFTGNLCTDGEELNLEETPPTACYTQWKALVNKCGGASNVASFDWTTCTGTCSDSDCKESWDALSRLCGGVGNISSWDSSTCTGNCIDDPTPDVENDDAPPAKVATETKTNSDGTSTNTTTTTYDIDGTTYTTTTITNYDSDGNVTGISTTKSEGSSDGDPEGEDEESDPTYEVPSTWYKKKYDIANGLSSYLNYQKITAATYALQGTAVYQVPNLLLQCLGYVQGENCEYPPALTIDFHNRFSSQPIVIDLSPFYTVVKTIKFFFAIICLVGTAKLTMILFQ
ncbi:MAG: hypothetical protein AB7U29_18445 [Desulfobulbus sp.]